MTETGNPPPEGAESSEGVSLIRSLRLTNFLSFGPEGEEIELRSLNVLVGANGSGKSNLIEALAVLIASPEDLTEPFRKGGGVSAWINGGSLYDEMSIEIRASRRIDAVMLVHRLTLTKVGQRLSVLDELIGSESMIEAEVSVGTVYSHQNGVRVALPSGGEPRQLIEDIKTDQSVLSLLKNPKSFPELAHLQRIYGAIRPYRNWTFGPESSLRKAQTSDLPNEWVAEDYSNLFLILNRLDFEPEAKVEFLARLRDFLPNVTDYKLQIVGGTIQMFLMEGRQPIPAVRLSDGTLRWLCLLAILVAPAPPSVVVLEEPELGLHPDMINTLADLLKQASKRMQLVVTTHSDILIDALSDVPESVMVVEKGEGGTTVRRLNAEELKPWLEEYRLGRLWMQGQIGGTRW